MSRKIEDLHPAVASKLRALRELAAEHGVEFIVTSTLRTEAEQMAYFAQGRKPLAEVNRLRREAGLAPIAEEQNRIATRNLTSVHQFGCAFDVAIVRDGVPVWDAQTEYEELGALGESLGLRWGGRFRFRDYCHFEYTGGLTLAELKEGKRPQAHCRNK